MLILHLHNLNFKYLKQGLAEEPILYIMLFLQVIVLTFRTSKLFSFLKMNAENLPNMLIFSQFLRPIIIWILRFFFFFCVFFCVDDVKVILYVFIRAFLFRHWDHWNKDVRGLFPLFFLQRRALNISILSGHCIKNTLFRWILFKGCCILIFPPLFPYLKSVLSMNSTTVVVL